MDTVKEQEHDTMNGTEEGNGIGFDGTRSHEDTRFGGVQRNRIDDDEDDCEGIGDKLAQLGQHLHHQGSSSQLKRPHLQGRFSGRLATKEDERRLVDECALLGPLISGSCNRDHVSPKLTLAKIVRGIASGEVRMHCEIRERMLKDLHDKIGRLETENEVHQLRQLVLHLQSENESKDKRIQDLEAGLIKVSKLIEPMGQETLNALQLPSAHPTTSLQQLLASLEEHLLQLNDSRMCHSPQLHASAAKTLRSTHVFATSLHGEAQNLAQRHAGALARLQSYQNQAEAMVTAQQKCEMDISLIRAKMGDGGRMDEGGHNLSRMAMAEAEAQKLMQRSQEHANVLADVQAVGWMAEKEVSDLSQSHMKVQQLTLELVTKAQMLVSRLDAVGAQKVAPQAPAMDQHHPSTHRYFLMPNVPTYHSDASGSGNSSAVMSPGPNSVCDSEPHSGVFRPGQPQPQPQLLQDHLLTAQLQLGLRKQLSLTSSRSSGAFGGFTAATDYHGCMSAGALGSMGATFLQPGSTHTDEGDLRRHSEPGQLSPIPLSPLGTSMNNPMSNPMCNPMAGGGHPTLQFQSRQPASAAHHLPPLGMAGVLSHMHVNNSMTGGLVGGSASPPGSNLVFIQLPHG